MLPVGDDSLHDADGISTLLIYLGLAVVLVPLCRALGVSGILGYLAVGILIGPSGLDVARMTPRIETASEIGVLFLLFTIGLELSTARLRGLRSDALGLGSTQILLTGLVLGAMVFALSGSAGVAVAVGFSLTMSSTAIALQLLRESGDLSRRSGRAALGILLLQDVAVVPLLVILPILAGKSGSVGPALALAMLKAVLATSAIVVLGRLVLRRAYRTVTALREPQIALALTLLVAVGTGHFTGALGLSVPLGAFLAGVLIAETEFRHHVEADAEPFRGLLLGVFFMSVGLSIDLSSLAAGAWRVVLIAMAIIGTKAAILYALSRSFGLTRSQGVHLSLLLAQAGEFGLVALGLSVVLGLLTPTEGSELMAAIALTMFATPGVAIAGRVLSKRLAQAEQHGVDSLAAAAAEFEGHVVVAGCGRVGSTVVRVLTEHGVAAVAIDLDPVRVARLRSLGVPAFVGDAARPMLLDAAGADRAKVAVVTLDDPGVAERVCAELRQAHPTLEIVARASDRTHADRLRDAGASLAVAENLEASLELAGRALEVFDHTLPEIERCLDELRANDYALLDRWEPRRERPAGSGGSPRA